jgi:hypothetical protein
MRLLVAVLALPEAGSKRPKRTDDALGYEWGSPGEMPGMFEVDTRVPEAYVPWGTTKHGW